MEEERRTKRSRFDDRPSKAERRSASPPRKAESTPPVAAATAPIAAVSEADAAAAAKKQKAAEAAARISAMLKAKKAAAPAVTPTPPPISPAPRPPPEDVNEQGLYVRDIEVNDLRNRYLVVKESTLEEIKTKTGADIEVRGKYYPDKSMATERDPPMFLHISSEIKTKMEAAVGMANKLINSELGPLVDERRFRKKEDFERDEFGRRKWPEERVLIDMPQIRGFHTRAMIVGTGGENVKFIQAETRTKIQIKGQGSGFIDVATEKETDEPMHLHIAGPDMAEVQRAKGMVEDLVAAVRVKYDDFKANGSNDGPERNNSPAQNQGQYGSPAPGSYAGYAPPPPPGSSAAIAPPFGYSSAPPPPASSTYAPPPPSGPPGSYGSAYPAPPGASASPYGMSYSPPPPAPGRSDEYDPYAPSTGSSYPRPPGT